MAFSVFDGIDPRKIIRTKIGTNRMIDGELELCISITDDDGHTMHVPIYLREERIVECPAMPYVELALLGITAVPHSIRASVRMYKALISIDITFSDMDNIDVTSFGKKVADAFVDLVRTNQEGTIGIFFYNVWNEGRLVTENTCDEVILHWIMELTAENHDAC